jgi:tRNA C32,U32 (ribose-2'-O)-methylase TrmJ
MLLLGTNGTGKSSVVDAIEYRLSGKSSLFIKNYMGVNWELASAHVRSTDLNIEVQLSDGKSDHTISNALDHKSLPQNYQMWLSVARKSRFVLRRHMLLSFINSEPAERYGFLAQFLDLDKYDRFETSVRGLFAKTQTEMDQMTVQVQNFRSVICRVFGLSIPPEQMKKQSLLDVINENLRICNIPVCSRLEETLAQSESIDTIIAESGKVSAQTQKEIGLRDRLQRITLPSHLRTLLDQLEHLAAKFEGEARAEESATLGNLLQQAKDIISSDKLERCPVCERDFDRDQIIARIAIRIAGTEYYRSAKLQLDKQRKLTLDAARNLQNEVSAINSEWGALFGRECFAFTNEFMQNIQNVLSLVSKESVKSNEISSSASVNDLRDDEITTLIDVLSKAILQRTADPRVAAAHKTKALLRCLMEDVAELTVASKQKAAAEKKYKVLESVVMAFERARKETVTDVLNSVAVNANKYYEAIHQNENIAGSKLLVRRETRASIVLSTEFDGKEEPPLLHLSESHLDTLGLAYFLALRRKEAEASPEFKLMVLDDVMHSVDADHRLKVCELLRDEFTDHQLIITTHDPILYEMLKRCLGSQDQFSYQRITNWSLARGPVFSDPSTDADQVLTSELREQARPGDLSSSAGRFMESTCKILAEKLQISIRFQSKYTIADLWPSLSKKIRKNQGFMAKHPDILSDLDSSIWIRNELAAHSNESSSPPTDSEVRGFAVALARLYKTVYCDTCNRFIETNGNDDFVCRCGKLFYPNKVEKST